MGWHMNGWGWFWMTFWSLAWIVLLGVVVYVATRQSAHLTSPGSLP